MEIEQWSGVLVSEMFSIICINYEKKLGKKNSE